MIRWILFGLWAVFTLGALFFAGGSHEQTLILLETLIGDYSRPSPQAPPVLGAWFNLMGVMPLFVGLLLAADSRGSWKTKVLFTSLGMVGGAFVQVPYLIFRDRSRVTHPPLPAWAGGLLLILLLAAGLFVTAPAWSFSAWSDFGDLFATSAFLRTMALDLGLFLLVIGLETARLLTGGLTRRTSASDEPLPVKSKDQI